MVRIRVKVKARVRVRIKDWVRAVFRFKGRFLLSIWWRGLGMGGQQFFFNSNGYIFIRAFINK